MENTLPHFSNLQNLTVTPETAKNLQPAMCWAKIVSIFGFIISGFMFAFSVMLLFLLPETILGTIGRVYRWAFLLAGFFFLGLTVCLLIASLNLLNAAASIRKAVVTGDSSALARATLNLKRHFMLYGIFTIASVCFPIVYTLLISIFINNINFNINVVFS